MSSVAFPGKVAHLIRFDEPLAPHLWLGIGGPARYFAEPNSREELIEIVREASRAGIVPRILGGGSNLLARESGVDGLVISLASVDMSRMEVAGDRLTACSGAKLSHVVTHAVESGLAGLESLLGIPGTVGGALVGNACAGGQDIGAVTSRIEVLTADGETEWIDQEAGQFSHRRSNLGGELILSAEFQLTPTEVGALTKRLQKLWIVRNASLPQGRSRIAWPFVDPDGATAERLIADIGLAGLREGGASLLAEHPGVLVAKDDATSDDCLKLIERVREQVLLQTGIDLQTSLQIW
ncbi:MAG: UDP-N-acetylmuramate dehydrogenase [Planctomycetaceae bacterium]|nr:MAG: UDP-N-acetylmuramate dehydrogenase [Planctomycetaceae bacterium]